jgi:hypothetical protein
MVLICQLLTTYPSTVQGGYARASESWNYQTNVSPNPSRMPSRLIRSVYILSHSSTSDVLWALSSPARIHQGGAYRIRCVSDMDTPGICIQSHYLNLDTRWLDTCIQYVWADFRYGPTEYLAFEQYTINPLLVLVLIGLAFFHYWWLIGYCLYLSFPFSIR